MFTVIHVWRLSNKCPLSRAMKSKALLINASDAGNYLRHTFMHLTKEIPLQKLNFNKLSARRESSYPTSNIAKGR